MRMKILFLFLAFFLASGLHLFAASEQSTIDSSEITESSGIVKSRKYDDIFWTHNDSGDTARIFAIHSDGTTVATVTIDGAYHVDWEDIAISDAGQIYICDIGDNLMRRDDLVVYQIAEPKPEDQVVRVARKIKFHYESKEGKSAHFDAEACFFSDGNLYFLTKHRFYTELFRLNLSDEEPIAKPISSLGITGRVTGADVAPDGKRLAVLTYMGIYIFDKPKKNDDYLKGQYRLIEQFFGQAEGIAFDGAALIITNEESEILKVTYK
ncbi:MAG: hypothetical protein AAB035_04205 [Nitrospirota bacterium]